METKPLAQDEIQTESEMDRGFSFTLYFEMLVGVLGSPRRFFAESRDTLSMRPALGCLLVSGIFYAGASLTLPHHRPLFSAGILFLNAVGMCFLMAILVYTTITMTMGGRVGFSGIFSVVAFSSSVTLLAAWIPLFVWITEPWKWLLIGVGLTRGCGLRWFQAAMVLAVSIAISVIFFWSFGSAIVYLKG